MPASSQVLLARSAHECARRARVPGGAAPIELLPSGPYGLHALGAGDAAQVESLSLAPGEVRALLVR